MSAKHGSRGSGSADPGRTNGSNGTPVRAFVVDDHPVVVEGLRRLAEQRADLELVGAADDVEGALDALSGTMPDVIVTELELPGSGGFGLIRQVRARFDGARVLVLSGLDQGTYVQRAIQAGAQGFVAKTDDAEAILRAIHAVHRGETYVSEALVDAAGLDVRRLGAERGDDPLERLSNREVEVFRMIGEGRGTREIARVLERSIKTVEAHREHIKQKLGLRDGSALLQRAIQWVWERRVN